MSNKIGGKVPSEVYDLIGLGRDNSRENIVVQLYTVDDAGFPHACLLSPYQVVLAKKEGECITLLVNSTSTTSKNLIKREKATLVFFVMPRAFYIKGKVRQNAERTVLGSDSVFSMEVQEVKLDYSSDAPILSNPTFDDTKVKSDYERKFRRAVDDLQLRIESV